MGCDKLCKGKCNRGKGKVGLGCFLNLFWKTYGIFKFDIYFDLLVFIHHMIFPSVVINSRQADFK